MRKLVAISVNYSTNRNRAADTTSSTSAALTAASPSADASTTSRLNKGATPVARARNIAVNASAAGPRNVQHAQPAKCPGLPLPTANLTA